MRAGTRRANMGPPAALSIPGTGRPDADAFRDVLDRPVLSVRDHTYRWRDVVAFARASGEWEVLGLTAARGVRRLAAEDDVARALVDQALGQAAEAFRRARSLLAADELTDWLERWALSVDEWLATLRAAILASASGPEPAIPTQPADDRATWAAAVCSGALRNLTGTLATGLAARVGLGRAPVAPDALAEPDAVTSLRADTDRYVASHVSDEQLEIEVHNHRLDWTLVSCDIVVHDREEVLREVAMCVRHDGMSLRDAAARAGLTTSPVSTRIVEIDPALRGLLAAAGAREIVGPVSMSSATLLAQVTGRAAPTLSDPDTRKYAQVHAAQRAVSVVVAEHAIWHDNL